MKDSIYITKEGVIYRKDNTIVFQNEEQKHTLPIEAVKDIYCIGKVTIRSGAAYQLMEKSIPVHFFGKYGHYRGTLQPKQDLISGEVIVKQVQHYTDYIKRIKVAKEMFKGIKHNILWVLKYYKSKRDIEDVIEKIEHVNIQEEILKINTLRSLEGQIWELFYQAADTICPSWGFRKRTRRPPLDEGNALISYGNSVLYGKTISEIFKTYLHPAISFIHEPSERRYSLALDLADIFKPVIVFRTVFRLINQKIISKKDFEKEVGVQISEKGKKVFITELEKTFTTTVRHPNLKRNTSYQFLIRLEGLKIMKHVLGDKKYESFKAWW